MLVKYCKTEDVPLVNIVRSAAAAEELTALGAEHVSTQPHRKAIEKHTENRGPL